MAREEAPREDLIREAVALTRRLELLLQDEPAPVVIGFRKDGSVSAFFGEDPAIHFNSLGQLRRGYDQGRLLKAEHGRLVALTRVRTPHETQLVRWELNDREAAERLDKFARRLARLRERLASGQFNVSRQVPEDNDVLEAVRAWLNRLKIPLIVAQAPSAG